MEKTSESDVWDQDVPGGGSTFVARTRGTKEMVKVEVVRDDWDDDDDEEEEQEEQGREKEKEKPNHWHGKGPENAGAAPPVEEEDSTKIWEEANKRGPMPELVVAFASTSQRLPPPPPAALQPTLRILKRPSANNSANNAGGVSSDSCSPGSGSGGTSPTPRGTLAEREAQYQEARSRIFGRTNSSGVVVVRDPLGPVSEPEMAVKGFRERRKK